VQFSGATTDAVALDYSHGAGGQKDAVAYPVQVFNRGLNKVWDLTINNSNLAGSDDPGVTKVANAFTVYTLVDVPGACAPNPDAKTCTYTGALPGTSDPDHAPPIATYTLHGAYVDNDTVLMLNAAGAGSGTETAAINSVTQGFDVAANSKADWKATAATPIKRM